MALGGFRPSAVLLDHLVGRGGHLGAHAARLDNRLAGRSDPRRLALVDHGALVDAEHRRKEHVVVVGCAVGDDGVRVDADEQIEDGRAVLEIDCLRRLTIVVDEVQPDAVLDVGLEADVLGQKARANLAREHGADHDARRPQRHVGRLEDELGQRLVAHPDLDLVVVALGDDHDRRVLFQLQHLDDGDEAGTVGNGREGDDGREECGGVHCKLLWATCWGHPEPEQYNTTLKKHKGTPSDPALTAYYVVIWYDTYTCLLLISSRPTSVSIKTMRKR
jgi:hypothetical protein